MAKKNKKQRNKENELDWEDIRQQNLQLKKSLNSKKTLKKTEEERKKEKEIQEMKKKLKEQIYSKQTNRGGITQTVKEMQDMPGIGQATKLIKKSATKNANMNNIIQKIDSNEQCREDFKNLMNDGNAEETIKNLTLKTQNLKKKFNNQNLNFTMPTPPI